MERSGQTLDSRRLSTREWVTRPALQAANATWTCPRQARRGIALTPRQNLAIGSTVLHRTLSTQRDAQSDLAIIQKIEAQVHHPLRIDDCSRLT
jgi:hypothetical protein